MASPIRTRLAAETLGFGHGDARNADFVQRLLNLVQLERLDDRFDLFHVAFAPGTSNRRCFFDRREAQDRQLV